MRYAHDPFREAAGFLSYRFFLEMILPAALNIIESEAFAGGSYNCVYIAAGVNSIEFEAFGDKIGLKVHGKYGSQAETFAVEKVFLFAHIHHSA